MSSRTLRGSRGLPGFDFQRQKSLNPLRYGPELTSRHFLAWCVERIAKGCPHSATIASNIRVTPRLAKLVSTSNAQALPGVGIHHAQHPDRSPAIHRIVHKVQRPLLVRRAPGPQRLSHAHVVFPSSDGIFAGPQDLCLPSDVVDFQRSTNCGEAS